MVIVAVALIEFISLAGMIEFMSSCFAVAQAIDSPSLVIRPAGSIHKPMGEDLYISCVLVPESARGAIGEIRWRNRNGDLIGASSAVNRR